MRASRHWLHQRISAIILCLFTPGAWWLFKAINIHNYTALRSQICHFLAISLISIGFIFTLYHARLGLHIIIEDYVQRSKQKTFLIVIDTILFLMLLSFSFATFILFKGN